MNSLDPVVVMRPGGRVEWMKEKGPEHVVTEYYIYSYLGENTFKKHNELFKRTQACSYELGALAIICRSYAIKRDKIQEFHDKYLTGSTLIPFAKWNAHHQWLEEAVVDIESFFWFANLIGSTGERDWQVVVPETIGEILQNDVCAKSSNLR
jgi:hypothetical protein